MFSFSDFTKNKEISPEIQKFITTEIEPKFKSQEKSIFIRSTHGGQLDDKNFRNNLKKALESITYKDIIKKVYMTTDDYNDTIIEIVKK